MSQTLRVLPPHPEKGGGRRIGPPLPAPFYDSSHRVISKQ